MSEADRLLADLWAADEPPERDHAFLLAAMLRLERRRLQVNLLCLVPLCAAAAAVLWALEPQAAGLLMALRPALQPLNAAALAAAMFASWLLFRPERPLLTPA